MSTRPQSLVAFFDAAGENFARQYEQDPNFKERYAVWTSLIDAHAPATGGTLLDVGCGPGLLAGYGAAKGLRVVGLEPSGQMLALARQYVGAVEGADAAFVQGSLEQLPDLGLRADLVLCSSVLEYLDDLDRAMALLRDALLPAGRLIVSLPDAGCLYRMAESAVFGLTGRPRYRRFVKNILTPAALAARCARLGLTALETRHYATRHRLEALNPLLPPHRRAALFATVFRPA